jgi:hypothetical protein
MAPLIAMIVIVLVFALMLAGIIADRRARARMTDEEWENRERESSMLGASVLAIDRVLRPDLERAAAVIEDQRQGMMPGGEHQEFNVTDQAGGDEPETKAEKKL